MWFRAGPLPLGIAVLVALQLLAAATELSAATSTVGSIVVAWAVYLAILLRKRDTLPRQ
jgi:hypothetical protein